MSLPQLPDGLDPLLRDCLAAGLELAQEAGRVALTHLKAREGEETTLEFKGRRELVTAADRASERLIVVGLRQRFPDFAILAEEGVASAAADADKESRYLWVVDPIDGTTNFVHGHCYWAVSIGLFRDGQPWLGVVHAPMLGGEAGGQFYYGGVDVGAYCNGRSLRVSETSELRHAVVATGFSYRRNEEGINDNRENFGRLLLELRGIRRDGAASLDLCMVAAGVFDAYWEMYLQPYDVGAGMALVLGAGGELTDLGSGAPLSSGLECLASNGRITTAMRALLKGVPEPG
ncbi:MAG: inositol monophosphatase [Planctomycetota bacterium]|nr:MAG: inositol monophosphatase [Planctomycetota bacterium]